MTRIATAMEGAYGKGKYCPEKNRCLDLEDITKIMATSRDAKELLDMWAGWHTIARPIKKDYVRYVELANKGARELGFKDTGAMWRSKYDMPPEQFAAELDRLWEQVRPLYLSLHAYVRWKLREKYGDAVPAAGPIPAHLLGNMWAQNWDNVYPLVAPADADPGYDLTQILKSRKTDPIQMVKYGEGFFTSLGFEPLPQDVLGAVDVRQAPGPRSRLPRQRLGHRLRGRSAPEDVHRHHGRGLRHRPPRARPQLLPARLRQAASLFRDSANDGFHEAIGDTIALSVTPEYLVKLGFLEKAPDASKDIGLLLNKALEKIAFLPFGLLIDQWRWKVFSGEITPAQYNAAWWELRQKYQGVAPPAWRGRRTTSIPGAKYHVPANVPYTRYFLADILQFQFHRALVEDGGLRGTAQPLLDLRTTRRPASD